MKKAANHIFTSSLGLILCSIVLKLPMFFTGNIQEDSFITWRVAKNLLNYGTIGFNGEERISASTTHLYVFITTIFQSLFGKYFIYPLLIFSGILFAIGSIWLGKILFPKENLKRAFFVILINVVPPALAASCLGMEYGILFFLYNGLIYFCLFKNYRWAYFVFPILLLWTRIDTVIFLGLFFLAEFYYRRKFNLFFIIGGLIGLSSVVAFNYFYFGEWVNHTITAKKIAYKNLIQNNTFEHLLYQWAYYGGLIKMYSFYTFLLFVLFLVAVGIMFVQIYRNMNSRLVKLILLLLISFAITKITVFSFFKAYFDWYYWLPRVFFFVIVFYYFLQIAKFKFKNLLVSLLTIALYFLQLTQSYTIGYMEERQRMKIAADLNQNQVGIEHSILLEPAGIIPFFTSMYTYDEVGLVNKRINDEMIKDEKHWWINSVHHYQPDYILTIDSEAGADCSRYEIPEEQRANFDSRYDLVRVYSISKIHQEAPALLRWIYGIRPLGKDYFLYKKNNINL